MTQEDSLIKKQVFRRGKTKILVAINGREKLKMVNYLPINY